MKEYKEDNKRVQECKEANKGFLALKKARRDRIGTRWEDIETCLNNTTERKHIGDLLT